MTEQTHTPGATLDLTGWHVAEQTPSRVDTPNGSINVSWKVNRAEDPWAAAEQAAALIARAPTLAAEVEALKAENDELVEHIARRKAEAGELVATITRLASENATLKGERRELVAGFSQALHLLRNVEVFVMTRD